MDHLKILKEQQNRIHERQMRELMMRQNLGNNTYSIARLQQQRHETIWPEAEVYQDSNLQEASIQASLQERARQAVSREQQTGEAHRSGFLSGTATPIIDRIFNMTTPKTPTTPVPTLQMPTPERPLPPLPQRQTPKTNTYRQWCRKKISSGEMMTARDDVQNRSRRKP